MAAVKPDSNCFRRLSLNSDRKNALARSLLGLPDARWPDSRQLPFNLIAASYGRPVGDLLLDFGITGRLETFVQSVGYESWQLWKTDGSALVALGGGGVAAYRHSAN